MKRALLLHYLPGLKLGQTLVLGKITDNRAILVAGVSITLKNSYDGATSDSLGNFSLRLPKRENRSSRGFYCGYRPFRRRLPWVQRSLLLI